MSDLSRREIVDLIVACGGTVETTNEYDDDSLEVWSVCFGYRSNVASFDFAYLNIFSELEWLIAKLHPEVTDDAVMRLQGLVDLQHLELDSTPITNRSIIHLVEVTEKVTYLDVSDTQIGDDGIRSLLKWRSLEYVDVSRTRVTTRGVCALAELPQLDTLRFHGNELNTRDIEDIRNAFGTRLGDVRIRGEILGLRC